MKRLRIDLDDLTLALETSSNEIKYYLDTETGEIVLIGDNFDLEHRAFRERIQSDEERYVLVPVQTTPEGYRVIMHFIETVDDRQMREELNMAASGRGAFRRFREVLARYPEQRQRWFAYKDMRLRERALEWLEELGLEAVD